MEVIFMKDKLNNKKIMTTIFLIFTLIMLLLAFTINDDKLKVIISVINQHKDFFLSLFEIIKTILEILKVYFENNSSS